MRKFTCVKKQRDHIVEPWQQLILTAHILVHHFHRYLWKRILWSLRFHQKFICMSHKYLVSKLSANVDPNILTHKFKVCMLCRWIRLPAIQNNVLPNNCSKLTIRMSRPRLISGWVYSRKLPKKIKWYHLLIVDHVAIPQIKI